MGWDRPVSLEQLKQFKMAFKMSVSKPNIREKKSNISMFSATNQWCFDQDTCSGVRRKGLRSIGLTVAMVTTIMLPLSLKEIKGKRYGFI